MGKFLIACSLILGMLCAQPVKADLCVIVHPDSPVQSLTSLQVSDLYLGRARGFDGNGLTNESQATIFDQPENSALRAKFFRAVNAMSVERVTSYWARLRFSGHILPPEPLADNGAIIAAVSKNPQAIGYVDASAISGSGVKVVLRLKE